MMSLFVLSLFYYSFLSSSVEDVSLTVKLGRNLSERGVSMRKCDDIEDIVTRCRGHHYFLMLTSIDFIMSFAPPQRSIS